MHARYAKQALGLRSQRGQAMSEFIAALALFLPLFFGVVYIGKFADIKQQAIQASRFAAFERALDPSPGAPESDQVIAEEARARFFTDGARNQGKLAFQDNTNGLTTAQTAPALWTDLSGAPLLQSYADPDIKVTLSSNSMDVGAFTATNEGSGLFFDNLNKNGQVQADVEVNIANVASLPSPLNNLNLKVAARTVVAGDAWNGDGAQNVADHQTVRSDIGRNNPLLQGLQLLLTPLAAVFSDVPQGPQFGCLRPDVVPSQTAPGITSLPIPATKDAQQ